MACAPVLAPRRRGLCPPFPKLSASLEQGRPHSPSGTIAHSGSGPAHRVRPIGAVAHSGSPPARGRPQREAGAGAAAARSRHPARGDVAVCSPGALGASFRGARSVAVRLGRRGRTYRRGPAPQPKPRRVAPTGTVRRGDTGGQARSPWGKETTRAAPQLRGLSCRPPHPRPHGVSWPDVPARTALPGLGRRSAP
ncbi:hypothetical protein CP970_36060 [Streptomyces kanamyceticus]|uniref:Uncharacterized protein n=1 Tax=Streptomyces kanamyceticus TaxID=1967 RepID=A0A5J6GPE0_STRKN|nr:hypothetical protein CP970_36060 [Streptomyces kanamyceticus]